MTAMFLFIILGSTHGTRPGRLRPDRDRPRPDADPPDLDPGHQHLGQSGAQHRVGRVRRRLGALGQLWLFWVAPLVGGAIGGALYAWLAPKRTAGHRRPLAKRYAFDPGFTSPDAGPRGYSAAGSFFVPSIAFLGLYRTNQELYQIQVDRSGGWRERPADRRREHRAVTRWSGHRYCARARDLRRSLLVGGTRTGAKAAARTRGWLRACAGGCRTRRGSPATRAVGPRLAADRAVCRRSWSWHWERPPRRRCSAAPVAADIGTWPHPGLERRHPPVW